MLENNIHHFTICVAGIKIRINTMYTRTYWMCRDYICEGNPDFDVTITKKDLEKEQFIMLGDDNHFVGGYLEPTAVYRKIIENAIDYDTFMIHGAAIAHGNEGIIFSGKSGVGKTTHIKKWLAHKSTSFVVNGDKPLVRYIDNSFYVCGTPWSGKEYMNSNIMIPLKSIAFMIRNEDNIIEEIEFANAVPLLLNQIYIFKNADKTQQLIHLLNKMKESIRFYNFLSNNFKGDSFQVAYSALIDNKTC